LIAAAPPCSLWAIRYAYITTIAEQVLKPDDNTGRVHRPLRQRHWAMGGTVFVVLTLLSLRVHPAVRDWQHERDRVRRYAEARTAADTILIDERTFAPARGLKGVEIMTALTRREARGAASLPTANPVTSPAHGPR
jgi:hypothetical protein